MELQTWLKNQMDKHDINALGLSYAIEVSHVTIGKWIKGIYTPNPANCRKLAQYFGVPEDQVLTLAGHRTPRTAEPQPHYSTTQPSLRQAIQMFRQLDDDDQERILLFMRSILRERHRGNEPAPNGQAGTSPA